MDVDRFLKLFTFLSMEEIQRLNNLKGSDIRQAKQKLAFEATRITHGKKAAEEAQQAALAAFGPRKGEAEMNMDAIPTTIISSERITSGISSLDILVETGLTSSRGEAKRLIRQGGLYVNDQRVENQEHRLNKNDMTANGILLRIGKKKYHRLLLK